MSLLCGVSCGTFLQCLSSSHTGPCTAKAFVSSHKSPCHQDCQWKSPRVTGKAAGGLPHQAVSCQISERGCPRTEQQLSAGWSPQTPTPHTQETSSAVTQCRMLLGHSFKRNQTILLYGKPCSNSSTCCHVWIILCVVQWLVQPSLNHW